MVRPMLATLVAESDPRGGPDTRVDFVPLNVICAKFRSNVTSGVFDMTGPCKLCTYVDQAMVRAAFTNSGNDPEIGRQFGISHVSVGRHRREHLVKPMQAAATALDRGRAIRQQREEQQAAVERGDLLAIFKLDAIASDISRIAQRLDSSATRAAAAGQHGGHAALAGLLLR
jgi:hypothetical protein